MAIENNSLGGTPCLTIEIINISQVYYYSREKSEKNNLHRNLIRNIDNNLFIGDKMEIPSLVLSILELLGVFCAILAVTMGLTKGRKAVKLTGGGLIEVTVTYLLIASFLYLASYGLRFIGSVGDSWYFNAVGAIVAFGEGFCFLMIFQKIIEHLEQLKKLWT